jgi:hypothetical protein
LVHVDHWPKIIQLTSHGNRFNAGIEGRAENKDTGNTTEAIGECTRVVPVVEAEGGRAFNTTRDVAVESDWDGISWKHKLHSHDGEQEVGDEANKLDESEPELGLTKRLDTKKLETKECELQRVS